MAPVPGALVEEEEGGGGGGGTGVALDAAGARQARSSIAWTPATRRSSCCNMI